MTEKTDKFEAIEAFVEGRLSPEEQLAFEKKCLEDPAYGAALDEYNLLKKSIEERGRQEFRKKLAAWDEAAIGQEKSAFSFFKIAAAVFGITILGLVLTLILNTDAQDASKLAQSYFRPYPNVLGERNSAQHRAIDSLLQLYDTHKYSEVIDEFAKYIESDGAEASLVQFYLGESLLAAREYQRAAEVLGSFSQGDNALYEVARFHRALALLLAGDTDKATRALVIIHIEKGPYRERAVELLRHLGDGSWSDEADMPAE